MSSSFALSAFSWHPWTLNAIFSTLSLIFVTLKFVSWRSTSTFFGTTSRLSAAACLGTSFFDSMTSTVTLIVYGGHAIALVVTSKMTSASVGKRGSGSGGRGVA